MQTIATAIPIGMHTTVGGDYKCYLMTSAHPNQC